MVCGCFVNFETLSANDSDFVTHYINVGANSIWTGTLSEITLGFKKGNGINNETFAGDILIDHIEIVDAIPATPELITHLMTLLTVKVFLVSMALQLHSL